MLPLLFAAAPLVAAVACITLSSIGLSYIGRYGGSDTIAGRGHVKAALIVFYTLVVTQSAVSFLWSCLWTDRSDATLRLSSEYFGVGNRYGKELVDRYVTKTQDKCSEKGVFSTTNRTLVSFAAELLQSEYPSDHDSAVSVLHVLTMRKERENGAVEQICSSEQVVGSLFKLLRSKIPLDPNTKAYTAEIMAKLACNLRLTDIPGAAHSISSLLDPHPRLMKTAAQGHPEPPATGVSGAEPSPSGESQTRTDNTNEGEPPSSGETRINIANRDASPPITNEGGAEPSPTGETQTQTNNTNEGGADPSPLGETQTQTQTNNTNQGGARDKPLIVHGLEILCEFASDPGNCTEICNTTDLVPKIMAPVSHGMLKFIGNHEPKTVQIVKASLQVLAKLTSGTGKSSRELRHELSDNGRTAENIIWIKENSDDKEMIILAMKILTRLTSGDPQDSSLTVSEGRAPNGHRRDCEVNWEQVRPHFPDLVEFMNADGTSTENRAMTAEFLAQICAKSRTDQASTSNNHLMSVSNALSTVLEAIVTTEITDKTKRRFLASFLGLAVQICEKDLATALDFADAVAGLPMENTNIFVEKLKEIIFSMAKESEDEICLVITKAATKLVKWTLNNQPSCIPYFQQEDIVGKLDAIVNDMGDLERCLVLSGDADEMQNYKTLKTLVEEVRAVLRAAQENAGQEA